MSELVTVPNDVFKTPGRQLDMTSANDIYLVKELRRRMSKVMRAYRALGITACQIGDAVDFFIVSDHKLPGTKKFNYFINAEVEGMGEMVDSEECCLSIPKKVFRIKRYPRVKVTAMMLNGKTRTRVFAGLAAACIQQEHDHTNGILLSDKGELIKSL